jgi:hypothetical protein
MNISNTTLYNNTREQWVINLEHLKTYVDQNSKTPSPCDINTYVRSLGNWFSTQKMNYQRIEYNMTNPSIRAEWEDLLNDPRYTRYLVYSNISRDVSFRQTSDF